MCAYVRVSVHVHTCEWESLSVDCMQILQKPPHAEDFKIVTQTGVLSETRTNEVNYLFVVITMFFIFI